MDNNELRRLKKLEKENTLLTELLAEEKLDIAMLAEPAYQAPNSRNVWKNMKLFPNSED